MIAQEILAMREQVEEIGRKVSNMRSKNWVSPGYDEMIQASLARIEEAVQALHRRLSRPDVVEGCREDALAQAMRGYDLLADCNFEPNDDQLSGIGYAFELAGAKIKIYQNLARHTAGASAMAAEEAA